MSQFSIQKFLSDSSEKLRMRALLYFKIFLVSKKFSRDADITIFCQGIAQFPVDSFITHNTETFVGKLFDVSEKSGYRKTLCIMGGGLSRISIEKF